MSSPSSLVHEWLEDGEGDQTEHHNGRDGITVIVPHCCELWSYGWVMTEKSSDGWLASEVQSRKKDSE